MDAKVTNIAGKCPTLDEYVITMELTVTGQDLSFLRGGRTDTIKDLVGAVIGAQQ